MDIGYFYQILDIGISYEKGRRNGKLWRIDERKRLSELVVFWQSLLDCIALEENGVDCSEKLFCGLDALCSKYKLPNYQRVLGKKGEVLNSKCKFERKHDEERMINGLMKRLMDDMQLNLDVHKDKNRVYGILRVLHNLPKSMYGRNVLNENCHMISYEDALLYAHECMDEKMKQEYKGYFS